jgi:hypothetical protein
LLREGGCAGGEGSDGNEERGRYAFSRGEGHEGSPFVRFEEKRRILHLCFYVVLLVLQ